MGKSDLQVEALTSVDEGIAVLQKWAVLAKARDSACERVVAIGAEATVREIANLLTLYSGVEWLIEFLGGEVHRHFGLTIDSVRHLPLPDEVEGN